MGRSYAYTLDPLIPGIIVPTRLQPPYISFESLGTRPSLVAFQPGHCGHYCQFCRTGDHHVP
jgi:hypothetical protein